MNEVAFPTVLILSHVTRSSSSMSVPVTRFSMKLYGSVKGIEKERRRQREEGKCVVHPYSSFRFYWDIVSLVLLIISMLIIPVAITFFNTKMTSDPGWIVFNLSMDCWFLADIIINFHTGYILDSGEGDVILDLRKVRIHYLKTWFLIDLISTLPLDYILQVTSIDSESASASRAVKLFRLAKIVSLLRLLRISRLIRYVHQWEQIVGMQYDLAVAAVRIFNLVCLMLLIGHWNGCLQFLVPMLNDFPSDSWVMVDGLLQKQWGEQYSWCLFKAMSHMLCIGYGQQAPRNVVDLWMTMMSMVSGAVCFAMFIGHATALIQSMDSSKRQYKEKYTQVKEYMRYRRLPRNLRDKVYKYYEHRFQGKMFDEGGILNELSNNLREEIVNFNCRHLVSAVPFFSNADPEFVTAVVQKLKFEVFQPEDVIVKEGEMGKKMYFIQQGVVEIRKSGAKTPIKQLADGSFFGEICLIINDRRVASVVAISYCHTYSLHVDDFNDIIIDYPMMRKTLEQVAAERLRNIGHDNEKLRARLKETSFSEAETLAQRIVRHDDETIDVAPMSPARKLKMKQNGWNHGMKLSKSTSTISSPFHHRRHHRSYVTNHHDDNDDSKPGKSDENYFKVVVNDSFEEEKERESKGESGEPCYRRFIRGWSIAKFTKGRHFSKHCWLRKLREDSGSPRRVHKLTTSLSNVPFTPNKDPSQEIPRFQLHCCVDDMTIDRSRSGKIAVAVSDSSIHKKLNNCVSTPHRQDAAAKLLPIDRDVTNDASTISTSLPEN